ncbi:hypothetical protein Moror_10027 [Moniliophthora roreri MCA 2997]|uniref:Zn(2)-C6 fungal-type domain-containing protein n=1 Tax=Moniliophthora roreri (strain MCA 2997) TaxID=1381753 RepID=V2WVG6_MONRO|nr:hypothetical protein Moror_10027 [Moniliophthora roreri MCA 2997]KAI3615965.1 hypothetical protein WG66_010498 [Moniliophthora roreri]
MKHKSKVVACLNCRRAKTRCEMVSEDGCHRCRVLRISCSRSTNAVRTSQKSKSQSVEEISVELDMLLQSFLFVPPESEELYDSGSILDIEALPVRIQDWFQSYNRGNWSCDGEGEELQAETPKPDWYTPLAYIRTLFPSATRKTDFSGTSVAAPMPVEDILSREQISLLLDSFVRRHGPWLGFKASIHHPLLSLVCCAVVASCDRQACTLPSATYEKLRATTIHTINILLANPGSFPASEALQALLITALWPAGLLSTPRALIRCAIELARVQGLEEVFEAEHSMNEKACLWVSLINADIITSVESRTPPLLDANHHGLFSPPATSIMPADINVGQDERLKLLLAVSFLTARALKVMPPPNDVAGVDWWYKERREVMRDWKDLERVIDGLTALVSDPNERTPFCTLNMLARSCHLMVYHDVLYIARKIYELNPHPDPNYPYWVLHVQNKHFSAITIGWMKDSRALSEEILINSAELDTGVLLAAPEYVFLHLGYVATHVLGMQLQFMSTLNAVPAGLGLELMDKMVEKLQNDIQDHPARKCSHFISGLLTLWRQRKVLMQRS